MNEQTIAAHGEGKDVCTLARRGEGADALAVAYEAILDTDNVCERIGLLLDLWHLKAACGISTEVDEALWTLFSRGDRAAVEQATLQHIQENTEPVTVMRNYLARAEGNVRGILRRLLRISVLPLPMRIAPYREMLQRLDSQLHPAAVAYCGIIGATMEGFRTLQTKTMAEHLRTVVQTMRNLWHESVLSVLTDALAPSNAEL
jgi:hypothetical protein